MPTLLVVDDHLGMRALLHDLVQAAFPKAQVLSASNGEEALALTLARRPVLVVMDVVLPHMNGIEATRRIKQHSPATTVVILSLYEAPEYRADALAAGASAYLFKRQMHLELIPTLKKFLAQTTLAPEAKPAPH